MITKITIKHFCHPHSLAQVRDLYWLIKDDGSVEVSRIGGVNNSLLKYNLRLEMETNGVCASLVAIGEWDDVYHAWLHTRFMMNAVLEGTSCNRYWDPVVSRSDIKLSKCKLTKNKKEVIIKI